MPRSVGKVETLGRALVSHVTHRPRTVVVAFLLLVVLSTQGAVATPGITEPASTGTTLVGP